MLSQSKVIKKKLLDDHLKEIKYKAGKNYEKENNEKIIKFITELLNLTQEKMNGATKNYLKPLGQFLGISGYAINATSFPERLQVIIQTESKQNEPVSVMTPDFNNGEVTHFDGWEPDEFLLYFLCFMVECYAKLSANALERIPENIRRNAALKKMLFNEIWIIVNSYKIYESYKKFNSPIDSKNGDSKDQRKLDIAESKIIDNLLDEIIRNNADDEVEYAGSEVEYVLPCGPQNHAVYVVLCYDKNKQIIDVRVYNSSEPNGRIIVFKSYNLCQNGKKELTDYLNRVILQLCEKDNDKAMKEIYQNNKNILPLNQAGFPQMPTQKGPNCVVEGFMWGTRLRLKKETTDDDEIFSWLCREAKIFIVHKHEIEHKQQSSYEQYLILNSANTQLLLTEHLQQIKQQLYLQYQKKGVMLEFAPQSKSISVPITEQTFINLALVTQEQQQNREQKIRNRLKKSSMDVEEKESLSNTINEKNEDFQRQQLLNSWEMLSQAQEPISIDDLWSSHKNDPDIPQHLIIEGAAGIGKTTLCGFIATQWSQQKLWEKQFDWILWIPLRNLIDRSRYPKQNKDYEVKSLVLGECFGCLPSRKSLLNMNEQDELWEQLEENSKRVLYVLDGYDEIVGHELDHVKAAIAQLLESKHILLTTRPQAINNELFKEQRTRRLVTLGLSDENIPRYIENYFKTTFTHSKEKPVNSNEEKHFDSEPLLEGLKTNQSLWSVSHIPLHLSLICLAYAENKIQVTDLKQNFSLTQLYDQIVSLLLQRAITKSSETTKKEHLTKATMRLDSPVTQALEELAFRGMAQYDLILDENLLIESLEAAYPSLDQDKAASITADLVASGFLKKVNDQGNPAYQFIHLTFQEFFAACYLTKRLQQPLKFSDNWIEFIHKHKHIPRFAVMLWFTAGLLKNKDKPLQGFFDLLQTPPRDEMGLYHLSLMMRCIAEGGYPKELTEQVSQHLGQLIDKCWLAIRNGIGNKDAHLEMRAQSAQQELEWLGQQRLLTPKIEFPASSLNAILKNLNDTIPRHVINAAVRVLGSLNTPAPQILQALVALLKKVDIRPAAIKALIALNKVNPGALLAFIEDKDENVRKYIVIALGESKKLTPEILQGLLNLLKNESASIKQTATDALRKLNAQTTEVIQGLVGLLEDEDAAVKQAAAESLGRLTTPSEIVLKGLAALLKYENKYVKQTAINALKALKVSTDEIVEGLADLLEDKDSGIKQAATQAVLDLNIRATKVLRSLIALMNDENSHVQETAACAVKALKTPEPEIIQDLLDLLKGENNRTKQTAIQLLLELNMHTPEMLKCLVDLLKNEQRDKSQPMAQYLEESKDQIPSFILQKSNEKHLYGRQPAIIVLERLMGRLPETFQGLVALLKNDSLEVRYFAARALGELQEPTPEILPALVALLKDEKWQAREGAARALGELQAPTPEILQGLVALLKDNDSSVRRAAARVLGKLRSSTTEIIQGLVALLKDKYDFIREAAAFALGELNAPTPEVLQGLVALLEDEDDDASHIREAAARSLGKLKALTPAILQGLLALLTDQFRWVRQAAAVALGELNAPTPEVLQGLVALLKDNESNVRQAAARALGELKATTPKISQALVSLLKDNNRDVRQAAARALGEFKAPTPEILQGLVALLEDNESDVRQAAARALGELKATNPKISQALVSLLKDNDRDVRQAAARALGELQAPTPEILLALVSLLMDNYRDVRQAAARALGELQAPTPEILQNLVTLLKDKNWQTIEGAARALGELQAPTPEILLALVALLKDEKYSVREAAAEALARLLGEFNSPTPEILQRLVALLNDNDPFIKQAAAQALGALKAPTPEILLALIDLLKYKEYSIKQATAKALARVLGEFNSPTPEILQAIVALLKDKDVSTYFQKVVIYATRRLKTSDLDVALTLAALLKDSDSDLSQAAAQALAEQMPTPEILQGLMILLEGELLPKKQAATKALIETKIHPAEVIDNSIATPKDKNSSDNRQGTDNTLIELKDSKTEDIVARLNDKNNVVRLDTAEALRKFTQLPSPIVQELLNLLKDEKEIVKQASMQALIVQGPTPEICQGLLTLLKHEEWSIRLAAAETLGKLKNPTPEVIQGLVASLSDKHKDVRQAAALELEDLEELPIPTPDIVEGLVAGLKDEDIFIRQTVAQALSNFPISAMLNAYLQNNGMHDQSRLQKQLLTLIVQRWLANKQMVKVVYNHEIDRQEIYWLEQGREQLLPIPDNHPDFQAHLAETIKDLIGTPLLLTFTLSTTQHLGHFAVRPSTSSSGMAAQHKNPRQNRV